MSNTPWNRARTHALGALLVPLVGLGCAGPTSRSSAPLTPEEREVLERSNARIERGRHDRGEAMPVAVVPRDLSHEVQAPVQDESPGARKGAAATQRSVEQDGQGTPANSGDGRLAPDPRGTSANEGSPAPDSQRPTPATTLGVLQGRVSEADSRSSAPLVVLAIPIGRAPEHSKGTTRLTRGPESFEPPFLVVPIGETVRFQNDDDICHSFFSSSPNHEFELGLLDPQASQTYRVEQPGTVQVYCSLHSGKQVSIFAVPTPHFAVVTENGTYDLGRLEAGEYRVMLWSDGAVLQRHEVVVEPGARTLWNVGEEPLAPAEPR